jgi:hypothetical protein
MYCISLLRQDFSTQHMRDSGATIQLMILEEMRLIVSEGKR